MPQTGRARSITGTGQCCAPARGRRTEDRRCNRHQHAGMKPFAGVGWRPPWKARTGSQEAQRVPNRNEAASAGSAGVLITGCAGARRKLGGQPRHGRRASAEHGERSTRHAGSAAGGRSRQNRAWLVLWRLSRRATGDFGATAWWQCARLRAAVATRWSRANLLVTLGSADGDRTSAGTKRHSWQPARPGAIC